MLSLETKNTTATDTICIDTRETNLLKHKTCRTSWPSNNYWGKNSLRRGLLQLELAQPSRNQLVDRMMNRLLIRIGQRPKVCLNSLFGGERPLAITPSTVYEVLQVILSIAATTLASILVSADTTVRVSVYRYWIAVGVISLVVAFLLVRKALCYENRSAAFFFALACVFACAANLLAKVTFPTSVNYDRLLVRSTRIALASVPRFLVSFVDGHFRSVWHHPLHFSLGRLSTSTPSSLLSEFSFR